MPDFEHALWGAGCIVLLLRLQSLERLCKLPSDTVVLPGHNYVRFSSSQVFTVYTVFSRAVCRHALFYAGLLEDGSGSICSLLCYCLFLIAHVLGSFSCRFAFRLLASHIGLQSCIRDSEGSACIVLEPG